VPKSKVRKKTSYTPSAAALPGPAGTGRLARPSPRWYPVVMAAFLVLGLAWIVVYYMAGESVPLIRSLGSWNFAVGFAFLVVGLGMAVRWR
jgi:cell division protein CrgA